MRFFAIFSYFLLLSRAQQELSSSLNIGFYQSPSYYKGFPVTKINPNKYNVIKYSFANVNLSNSSNTYECLIGDKFLDTEKIFSDDDEKCSCCARGGLNQLFNFKAKNPHIRTVLSVGGWVWSTKFSDAVASADSRQKLASSCVKIMLDYGLDGLDIDWEFPGGGDGKTNLGPTGTSFKREDTENLIALFGEFRNQFKALKSPKKDSYLLTFDVHSLPMWYLNRNQLGRMASLLDWFNVMNYEVKSKKNKYGQVS